MSIENFSKEILNKDIPLNILKICVYLLTHDSDTIDIDETCNQMYITKRKLMGEIDKTKPIEGFFSSDIDSNGTHVFYILDKKFYLKSEKKKKKNQKEDIQIADAREASIQRIFEYWRNTMNKSSRTKLDKERRKNINTALQSYTEEECCMAISGCSKNPWNMGHNPRQKEYNSLELIFRNAEYTEGFIKESEGLSLEEKVKLENDSKPVKIEDRLQDDSWAESRLSHLENTMKGEQINIENKSKNETLSLEDKSISYNPDNFDSLGLAKASLIYLGFENENFYFEDDIIIEESDNEEIIVEAEFEEIVEGEVVETEKEEDSNIPLYMRILKESKEESK